MIQFEDWVDTGEEYESFALDAESSPEPSGPAPSRGRAGAWSPVPSIPVTPTGPPRPRPAAGRRAVSTAAWVAWDDPSVDWSAFDAAWIRSTWNYTAHYAEFLRLGRRGGGRTELWNPADDRGAGTATSRTCSTWPTRGVAVVPTVLVPAVTPLRRSTGSWTNAAGTRWWSSRRCRSAPSAPPRAPRRGRGSRPCAVGDRAGRPAGAAHGGRGGRGRDLDDRGRGPGHPRGAQGPGAGRLPGPRPVRRS